MKRWQDRGEVLDSEDDEDSELEADEASPVRKKARVDGQARDESARSDENVIPGSCAVENLTNVAEEEAWLRPKVAIAYGKKSRSARSEVKRSADASSARTSTGSEDLNKTPKQSLAAHDGDGRDCTAAERSKSSSTLQRGATENAPARDVHVATTAEPASPQTISAAQDRAPGLEAQSLDSENLPDVHDLLQRRDSQNARSRPTSAGKLSSGLSSPLSERSLSPPAPPVFRFPRRGGMARHPSPAHLDRSFPYSPSIHDATVEQLRSSAPPIEIVEDLQTGRRTFRARKAQQLHPYEYEKLQYQKQFRERGLRPVKIVDPEQRSAEAQNTSSDNEQDSWQPSQQEKSSPPRADHETKDLSASGNGRASDDEIPETRARFRRTAFAVVQHGSKRQKLSHHRVNSTDSGRINPASLDGFSVPPSPPPTSSESNDSLAAASRPAVFKFPRGMTPSRHTQQATPNVSSDLRHAHLESEDDLPRNSRPSTSSRTRHLPIPVGSSTGTSSSESEPDNDPDVRRLLKERKRIRGVLPASWLKIDFKAQQRHTSPSPAKKRQQATESPEKAVPQKGVAQRVCSRPSATQHAPIPISDDESDNDLSTYLSASKERQSRLQFNRNTDSMAPIDFDDEGRMEVDHIDAMLAGTARSRRRGQSSRTSQPRIADAFTRRGSGGQDVAEERREARRAGGLGTRTGKRSKTHIRRQTASRQAAPQLSILDAPRQKSTSPERQPQFVKLAMRKARTQQDCGRHSPSRKHIRLATEQDTEDASSMLQAWREGTIVPRGPSSSRTVHQRPQTASKYINLDELDALEHRRPLAELSGNQQSCLLKPASASRSGQQVGARKLHVSKPRMRQSRLEPISLEGDEPPEEAVLGHSEPLDAHATDSHAQRRPAKPRAPPRRYRGAQLESLESDFDRGHGAAAFEGRMHVLTENVVRGGRRRIPAAPIQLARFLHDPDMNQVNYAELGQPSGVQELRDGVEQTSSVTRTLARRPRKRTAQRVDAEARQYRQPSEPLPQVVDVDAEEFVSDQDSAVGLILQGLGPFGTRYSIDFDTLPLPLGTYFHESSFIGSGDFAASLGFAGRNLDVSTGRIRIHVGEDVLDLGIWNEEVAAGLGRIPHAVTDALGGLEKDAELRSSQDSPDVVLANVDYLLRSTVRYFARCLAFSDPIDRRACVQSLQRIAEDLLEGFMETGERHSDVQSRCLQYAAVLARQGSDLCSHRAVPPDVSHRSQQLLQRASDRLASHFVSVHIGELRVFYEDLRRAAKREAGIHDTDAAICSLTVLRHVLKGNEHGAGFWGAILAAMNVRSGILTSVSGFDRAWSNLFAILPALEIDAHGILQLGSRLRNAEEDWSVCKALLERLFILYSATSTLPGLTINEYVRATFARCSRLQSRWAWYRCQPILYTISDFFARRGLAPLHKEECHGSPSFLQELDKQPSLEMHRDDRSFHIFLKMLASGLRSMRERGMYPDKKIGGIAWRFIPNHGRTHRKDADVRQEDLDALRNHHDLLSTLYYASPPSNRIRIDLIQNLVDHIASHREACRLNVRAWRNLAAFQASTHEPVERLAPFNAWFRELLTANIMQFRRARTEVEQDVASAVASGKPAVSQGMIENIITANQRQVAATITDALAAVKHALKTAASSTAASTLLEGTKFWQALDLFDSTARKVSGIFDEVLEVIKTALEVQRKLNADLGSQLEDEDSQDYGDSRALQELASTQMPEQQTGASVLDTMYMPLMNFVSSVFGADGVSDDGLLTKVVDVWVDIASATVSHEKKTWESYINGYGSEAWTQLRDTEQRRKFTPYFLARIVESRDVDLAETGILSFWLKSLVEREATLKFQHTLTNALLDQTFDEPLLHNLPFVRERSGQLTVSLHQLRQCRLGLVSSVLSNMHRHLDETLRSRPAKYVELRRTYADMLRQTMQAMKLNYQEIQNSSGGDAADPNAQGEYVGFVQQVVSFLQQYTADVCPIDRFFTDSTAFPLPATDPTYVVGRLKGYVPKLSDSGRRKELAVFVQTVSERAAVDGQQEYLADQLTTAMTGVLERGDLRAPSLRSVMMTAIFPAYIENALSTACSWVLVLPILQACGHTMQDLLYSVRLEDEDSVQIALQTMSIPIRSMMRAVEFVLAYPGQLMFAHVLSTLRTIFDSARRGFTAMHHVGRAAGSQELALSSTHLSQCGYAIDGLLSGDDRADIPGALPGDSVCATRWQDTGAFSQKQFKEKMNGWHAHEGQYFVRRGASSVEVIVHLEDQEEEKQRLIDGLHRYQQSYEAVFRRGREGQRSASVMDELVV